MCDNCNSEPTGAQSAVIQAADIPIACNPSAMGGDWEHHQTVVAHWHEAVEETVELPDGYAYRFPAQTELLMTVAAFVSRERLCCPFFTFQIEVNPQGQLWLRLTGPDGIKPLLQDGLNILSK
jgi:hypothetical protein